MTQYYNGYFPPLLYKTFVFYNLELNLTMYSTMDLSSNKLEGIIPSYLLQAEALHLSNINFSSFSMQQK